MPQPHGGGGAVGVAALVGWVSGEGISGEGGCLQICSSQEIYGHSSEQRYELTITKSGLLLQLVLQHVKY